MFNFHPQTVPYHLTYHAAGVSMIFELGELLHYVDLATHDKGFDLNFQLAPWRCGDIGIPLRILRSNSISRGFWSAKYARNESYVPRLHLGLFGSSLELLRIKRRR